MMNKPTKLSIIQSVCNQKKLRLAYKTGGREIGSIEVKRKLS